MAKSDKTFDEKLDKEYKKATKAEKPKEKIKMKNLKEQIKTWTIVVLVTAILCSIAYFVGHKAGYTDYQAFNSTVKAEVQKLKPVQQ